MQTETIRLLFKVKNSLADKKISKLNVYVFSYINKLINPEMNLAAASDPNIKKKKKIKNIFESLISIFGKRRLFLRTKIK